MKRLLLVVTMLSAGAIFAGCQQTAPAVSSAPESTASPKQETSTRTTTTTTPTSDADEIKMIDNDLKQLDATKDFPDFSQSDLE